MVGRVGSPAQVKADISGIVHQVLGDAGGAVLFAPEGGRLPLGEGMDIIRYPLEGDNPFGD